MEKAMYFAIEKHGDQMYGDKPYVYHLGLVADVLIRFGYDDNFLLQAAFLHDVIEDTDATYEEVEREFGTEVAKIVHAVTDEPGKNRRERKAKTYPKIKATPHATLIKLADRIANIENPNGMKNDMYKREHPTFKQMLQDDNHSEMWKHLDRILEA